MLQPVAEAVYALVEAHGGGTTHLTYMLTIPEPDKVDEVQKELGVVSQASFVAQVRVSCVVAAPRSSMLTINGRTQNFLLLRVRAYLVPRHFPKSSCLILGDEIAC